MRRFLRLRVVVVESSLLASRWRLVYFNTSASNHPIKVAPACLIKNMLKNKFSIIRLPGNYFATVNNSPGPVYLNLSLLLGAWSIDSEFTILMTSTPRCPCHRHKWTGLCTTARTAHSSNNNNDHTPISIFSFGHILADFPLRHADRSNRWASFVEWSIFPQRRQRRYGRTTTEV